MQALFCEKKHFFHRFFCVFPVEKASSLHLCISGTKKERRTEVRRIRQCLFRFREAYLILLSYGMPSAFGALERLEVKASTIREMM